MRCKMLATIQFEFTIVFQVTNVAEGITNESPVLIAKAGENFGVCMGIPVVKMRAVANLQIPQLSLGSQGSF